MGLHEGDVVPLFVLAGASLFFSTVKGRRSALPARGRALSLSLSLWLCFALLCLGVGTLADPMPRAQGACPSNILSDGESVRGCQGERVFARSCVPPWGQVPSKVPIQLAERPAGAPQQFTFPRHSTKPDLTCLTLPVTRTQHSRPRPSTRSLPLSLSLFFFFFFFFFSQA